MQEYSREQLVRGVVPTYTCILEHIRMHMSFAEPSTLAHYPALAQYVEIWNRHFQSPLPRDVLVELRMLEERTFVPLDDDIERHFKRLIGGVEEMKADSLVHGTGFNLYFGLCDRNPNSQLRWYWVADRLTRTALTRSLNRRHLG